MHYLFNAGIDKLSMSHLVTFWHIEYALESHFREITKTKKLICAEACLKAHFAHTY